MDPNDPNRLEYADMYRHIDRYIYIYTYTHIYISYPYVYIYVHVVIHICMCIYIYRYVYSPCWAEQGAEAPRFSNYEP